MSCIRIELINLPDELFCFRTEKAGAIVVMNREFEIRISILYRKAGTKLPESVLFLNEVTKLYFTSGYVSWVGGKKGLVRSR